MNIKDIKPEEERITNQPGYSFQKVTDLDQLEKLLNKFGTIMLEHDACENCKRNLRSVVTVYKQLPIRCQLKNIVKIMVDNVGVNQRDNGRKKYYHKGWGHKTYSVISGLRPTCRCRWVSERSATGHRRRYEVSSSTINLFIKKRLGMDYLLEGKACDGMDQLID